MPPSDPDIRNRLLTVRLPAMPQILLKLLELCQSDKAGMGELARLIGNDVSMSAKLLSVANSAAYYRSEPTHDLFQALGTLGANTIKLLVISESIFQTFNAFPHCGGTDLRLFWQHSLKTAVVARNMASHMDYPAPEEAYLAGLLHDVGRLALLSAAPNEYSFNFRAQDNNTLCEIELQTLQISHTEAGAWLSERWKFGPAIADSILYHHEPRERVAQAPPLTRIVHLAHELCALDDCRAGAIENDNRPPQCGEPLNPEMNLPEDAGALCDLPCESLMAILQDADQQVQVAAGHLGIVLPDAQTLQQAQVQARAYVEPATLAGQAPLAQGILDRALLTEFSLSLAQTHNDAALLEAIRSSTRVLFNAEDAALLLLNGDAPALSGLLTPEQQQRQGPSTTLTAAPDSRLARMAQGHEVVFLDAPHHELSTDERALLPVTGGEVLMLIPMSTAQQAFGLIVAGMARARLPGLQSQCGFLQTFGERAAQALAKAANERGAIDQQLAQVRQTYQDLSRHVAHEVNNPLAIIKNYLGVVDDKLARQESVQHELGLLNEEIDRVGHIVNEFAGVAPKSPVQAADLTSILHDLSALFRGSKFLPRHLDIIITHAPQTPALIAAPASTVRQILINLIKNAIEALPQGGRIELLSRGPLWHEGRLFMEVSVKDNGPGLTPEVMQQLFTPLVSAKPGPHRGIGLTIVHSMMDKLDGSITCQNSPSGATFITLFPCTQAADERHPPLTPTGPT